METLREMLDRHEREVRAQIEGLRSQLAPLERELGQIRSARAAIGEDVVIQVPSGALTLTGTSALIATAFVQKGSPPEPESPYRSLTMKELVLKALGEHFPNGASTGKLLDFFRHAWSREDIIRSSLSPQLSRLKHHGKITRLGSLWMLMPGPSENEAPPEHDSEGASDVAEEAAPGKDLFGAGATQTPDKDPG